MTVKKMGRRMFLGAAGGGLLAMPWLPSLLVGEAQAQDNSPRCFVSFMTGHGGILPQRFYPPTDRLVQTERVLDWDARWGTFERTVSGGIAKLSDVVTAPEQQLTASLADRMSFLMGVDYSPSYVGHNVAAHMGGYAQNLNTSADKVRRHEYKPTMDQIIGRADGFYGTPVSHPVLCVGGRNNSWYYAIPDEKKGLVVAQPTYNTAESLWQALFQPGGPGDASSSDRPYAVDRALESYQRLVSGSSAPARRLGARDRERLEAHMASLHEVERQLRQAGSCTATPNPAEFPIQEDRNNPVEYWQAASAMIRQAVLCGMTRVVTIQTNGLFLGDISVNDFHQQVPHAAASDNSEENGVSTEIARQHNLMWYQGTFEHVVLPVLQALDVDDGMGHNVLDSSLAMWTSECGSHTHSSIGVPLLTAGSLGGRFETGRFIDYRNMDAMHPRGNTNFSLLEEFWHPGLPYDQLLGSILSAFDVPRSDYDHYLLREAPGASPIIGGFGGYNTGGPGGDWTGAKWIHSEYVRQAADQPMPMFFKG